MHSMEILATFSEPVDVGDRRRKKGRKRERKKGGREGRKERRKERRKGKIKQRKQKILDSNHGDLDAQGLSKKIFKAPKVILILTCVWELLNIIKLYKMKLIPLLLCNRLVVRGN